MFRPIYAEWIRIRRHGVPWLAIAAHVIYLTWQLHTDPAFIARTPTEREHSTAFCSPEYLIPYVLTWSATPYLPRVAIWAATGALWAWADWRPPMPTEHLVRRQGAIRIWLCTRLVSLLAFACLVEVVSVAFALGIGEFHGFWPSNSHFMLSIRLAVSGVLYAWTTSILGFALAALWSNFALGALSAWMAWWLHLTTEPRILAALTLMVSPKLSWILAALDPFNNVSVMTRVVFTWGTSFIALGAQTAYPFSPADQTGIFLGSSASTHWALVRYNPSSLAAFGFLIVELALFAVYTAWAYSRLGRNEPTCSSAETIMEVKS
ncbi:hypothetical protein [Alicyclobacillus sendaiensis]|uniref:hypothetical protein n=1 Tax=Alicyclobacillus sendaiensis TaxID=192387 RepID=UPI000783DF7D|nr:hypothetical protein [Alicyclobacillus sendaiensis]